MRKTVLVVVVVLAVLVLSGRAVLRSEWLNEQVAEKIRTEVERIAGPDYSFTMGRLNVDAFRGDLSIEDLALRPDTSLLDSVRIAHGQAQFSAHAQRISVSGFSYWRLLIHDEVGMDSLRIDSPTLRYIYATHAENDTVPAREKDVMGETRKTISIGEFIVSNASGLAIDLAERTHEFSIGRMDAQAKQLRFVMPLQSAEIQWDVSWANVELSDVRAGLPPLYDLAIDHIGLSHPEGIVAIDSVHFRPRFTRENTHDFLREMTSIYTLDVRRVDLSRIDLHNAFTKGGLKAGLLSIDGARFDVFLDKSMPEDPSHFMPLPVSALRKVPFDITIDSIRLTNAEMLYAERFEVANGYGSMHMKDIDATLCNVSNDSLLAAAGKDLHGTVDMMLFDVGALHGIFSAPLISRRDAFTLDATVRDMPLPVVNSMSENLVLLRADSGWVSSMHMHMNANNDSATGTFTMKYDDAWLRIVKNDGSKRRFLTQMVNTILHHDDQEKPADEATLTLRIARKKDHSFFNFVWLYTREGLARTLLPPGWIDIHSTVLEQQERIQKIGTPKRKKKGRKHGS